MNAPRALTTAARCIKPSPRLLHTSLKVYNSPLNSDPASLRASASSASSSPSPPSPSTARPEGTPQPTNLPGSNLPPAKTKHSPLTVSVVTTLAKVFGYNSQTSTAIRTASDYYDRCAERGEIEEPFLYEECSLPPSFQTWFSLTTLHVWLLTVRFRSLPAPLGRTYIQELINHFFIDIELRIRGPYAVTQGRLIKGYMKDCLEQYHGSCAAYDEGLIGGDAAIAAAIWRNVFGAGWGGVAGVKGKKAPKVGQVPSVGPNPNPFAVDPVQKKALKKDSKVEQIFKTDQPILDPKVSASLQQRKGEPLYPQDPDLEFAQSLEKITLFVRREVMRMERLSDQIVMGGKTENGKALIDFTRL